MKNDYLFVKKRLGENLAQLRKSSGYSQQEFANRLNVSQSVVSAWESGVREMSLATIWEICDLFKVPVSTLLPISDSGMDEDTAKSIAEKMTTEPKWKLLFEKLDKIGPKKLDALLSFLDAIM